MRLSRQGLHCQWRDFNAIRTRATLTGERLDHASSRTQWSDKTYRRNREGRAELGFSGIARARATEQHETGHLAGAIEASDRRALRLQAIGVDFSRVFSLNNCPVRSSWPLRRVTFGPQARVSVRFCTILQSRQELCTTSVALSRLHLPSLENRGQLHCASALRQISGGNGNVHSFLR